MTPEERQLLHKIAETVDENNHMLHSVRRSMRWTSIMRWVYWIIIIGTSVGAFYLLQPYLNTLMDTYSNTQNSISNLKNIVNSAKR